jgi:hypothetical protein
LVMRSCKRVGNEDGKKKNSGFSHNKTRNGLQTQTFETQRSNAIPRAPSSRHKTISGTFIFSGSSSITNDATVLVSHFSCRLLTTLGFYAGLLNQSRRTFNALQKKEVRVTNT